MESQKKITLAKANLVLIAIGFIITVIGFIMMTGSGTDTAFNPDIFSPRRITYGPMTALFGFVFIIFAIVYKPKSK